MITIVDYGMGNLGSIVNMLKRIGASAIITSDPEVIARSDKLILPGVGAFDAAMESIREKGLRDALDECAIRRKVSVLGICLGMQLLTRSSDEGELPGLGWIAARTRAFKGSVSEPLKIPHMGWNVVTQSNPSPLIRGFDTLEEPRFYFVHSYYVECESTINSVLRCTYGVQFDAAIQSENVFGVQFHPEKSHRFGMKLLQNFAEI